MTQQKARTALLMASPEDAEAQFYDALRDGDLERLMNVWSDEEEILCVHPGGTRACGLHAVRATFEAVLSNGRLDVHPEHIQRLHSMDSAVHSVLERIEVVTSEGPRTGWIIATNVYHKTARGWRMIAHHASPGNGDEPAELTEAPSVLH